ncbi:MAG: peptide MFS transporter [Paraglaciecola sp.]|uniref:peptide MFS transporter n=1 Tax=Paraglaciecola sp. TaxID=1920173 RepID=UPI0032982D22
MNNKVWGNPKGVFLVSGVELWERFSYYGMLGLLVLFLTANANTGGLQWSTETALKLMGIYSGFIFAAPAIGGWIANNYWGERKCIFYGGLLVTVGHLLLGGPVYFPYLIDLLSDEPISNLLLSSNISYETLFADKETLIQVSSLSLDQVTQYSWLVVGYHLKLWSFLIGLGLIVMGTGLIKPAVSSIINHFYAPGSKSRDSGFAFFMSSIYLGAFSANFVAGTLGEKLGWHAGFSAAALGMVVGITAYIIWQKKYLGDIGIEPQNPSKSRNEQPIKLSLEHKKRLALVVLMGVFTVIYAVAFYQKGGMLNLYTLNKVNRVVWGFEIPATWFLSISTGIFIVSAPYLVKLVAHKFPKIDAIYKLALGLICIGIAYSLLALGDVIGGDNEKVSILWIVLTYILFGLGDVLVWPAQISAAAALAPKHLTSFVVGAWYLTIGIGSWLTGYVGALSTEYSHLSLFVGISTACLFSATVLMLCYGSLSKLSGKVSL